MPLDGGTREHDFAAIISLELLFRTEMDFVMNAARRCGLSDPDAEDVTQQVFITLQRRLHSLHSPESIRPWLLTVVRRTAKALIAERRRMPEEPPPYDFADIEDDVPLPEERFLQSERRRELLELIETIESARRIVFVMHVIDDLPMTEVAETLKIPVPTAYNRLRLARRDLEDALSRREKAEEFNMFGRSWDGIASVRDPWVPYYGRAPITPEIRERMWTSIVDAVCASFGSIELAERDGLRVLSPMFHRAATPRPYARPKRPRGVRRSVPAGLPRRRAAGETAAPTGSRTP